MLARAVRPRGARALAVGAAARRGGVSVSARRALGGPGPRQPRQGAAAASAWTPGAGGEAIKGAALAKRRPRWLSTDAKKKDEAPADEVAAAPAEVSAAEAAPSEAAAAGAEPSAELAEELAEEKEEQQFLEDASKLVVPDDGHDEVHVVSWSVAVGDEVGLGTAVCEIETPDYVYDFESKYAGVVAKLLVQPKEVIKPGKVIAYLAKTAEDVPKIVEYLAHQQAKKEEEERAAQAAKEAEAEAVAAEVEGTGGGGSADAKGPAAVLKELELSRYTQVLQENGYDTMPALLSLTAEDLGEMGFKKGHAKALLKWQSTHAQS